MLSVGIMSKRAHHKSKTANSHYFEKIEKSPYLGKSQWNLARWCKV